MQKIYFVRQNPDPNLNWIILGLGKVFDVEILETDLQPAGIKPHAVVVVGGKDRFPRALKAAQHVPVVWFNIGGDSFPKILRLKVLSKKALPQEVRYLQFKSWKKSKPHQNN
uniref:Uncharacterized protein n=1 Tax=candidate division WWE3 bacterium TaxID=2053526 RepID=A0A7C4TPF7_UNCKA